MTKYVYWDDKWLEVAAEQVGRVLVNYPDGRQAWVLKTDELKVSSVEYGRGKYYRRAAYRVMNTQTCVMCGSKFDSYRFDADCCSPKCRKAKSRQKSQNIIRPNNEV